MNSFSDNFQSYNWTRIDRFLDEEMSSQQPKIVTWQLTELEKFTEYEIVVQAFNSEGAGPLTDPIVASTLEDGMFSIVVLCIFYPTQTDCLIWVSWISQVPKYSDCKNLPNSPT